MKNFEIHELAQEISVSGKSKYALARVIVQLAAELKDYRDLDGISENDSVAESVRKLLLP